MIAVNLMGLYALFPYLEALAVGASFVSRLELIRASSSLTLGPEVKVVIAVFIGAESEENKPEARVRVVDDKVVEGTLFGKFV